MQTPPLVTEVYIIKVLIVYDSVSPSKVTMKVAKTIEEALREKGFET